MSRRQERISSLLLRELSEIISKKLADPRVNMVHLVRVDVSPDLSLARIDYSTLDQNTDVEKLQKGIESAVPFLKNELKKVLKLRKIPGLVFNYDPSIKRGDKMLELLRNLDSETPKQ